MHLALQVLCFEGKVRNEMKRGGWSGAAIVEGNNECGWNNKAQGVVSSHEAVPFIK